MENIKSIKELESILEQIKQDNFKRTAKNRQEFDKAVKILGKAAKRFTESPEFLKIREACRRLGAIKQG